MTTIKEGRAYLKKHIKDGVKCPCCEQHVKMYKRKLNSGMARVLIYLNRHTVKDGVPQYVNVISLLREHKYHNPNDWSALFYWRLIIEEPNHDDETKRSSGRWKLTNLGVMFVNQRVRVQSHINVYNSGFYGFAGKEINIIQALGLRFNYNELMNS